MSEAAVVSEWKIDRQGAKQDFLLCLFVSVTSSLFYGDVKARRKQPDSSSRIPAPAAKTREKFAFLLLILESDSLTELMWWRDVSRLTPAAPSHSLLQPELTNASICSQALSPAGLCIC